MEFSTKNPRDSKAKPRLIKCPDCGSTDLILNPANKDAGLDMSVVCKCGWRGYPQWPVEEVA